MNRYSLLVYCFAVLSIIFSAQTVSADVGSHIHIKKYSKLTSHLVHQNASYSDASIDIPSNVFLSEEKKEGGEGLQSASIGCNVTFFDDKDIHCISVNQFFISQQKELRNYFLEEDTFQKTTTSQ